VFDNRLTASAHIDRQRTSKYRKSSIALHAISSYYTMWCYYYSTDGAVMSRA
jgi:hypothetical protein